MSVLVILLSASLLIALFFLGAFLWSVKRGQYDDPVTPAMRILVDDVQPRRSVAVPVKEPTP
jgi:cbb3-type cytochrome oxidase maturation protein